MKTLARYLALLCGVMLYFCPWHVAIGFWSKLQCSSKLLMECRELSSGKSTPSQWDVDGAGDSTIQGFATDISVNVEGQVLGFKVKTNATAYTIEIYRMGYYAGMGARLVTTLRPHQRVYPKYSPLCLSDVIHQQALSTAETGAVSGVKLRKYLRMLRPVYISHT